MHAADPVDAPAEEVLARINPRSASSRRSTQTHCVLVTGGDSVEVIAVWIGMLGLDFHVDGPPALLTHLESLGTRYLNAIR